MSRLDVYLKNSGLFKQRSRAKQACDDGRVLVGGRPARASHTLAVGDVLSIDSDDQFLEAEVLLLPSRPMARDRRLECYRLLRRERRDPRSRAFGFDDEI